MSHMSMILSGLMMAAMLVFIAPGIFAQNRGHILRNVALWLFIFLGLALVYQNFGPESKHPLFGMPDSMAGMNHNEALKLNLPSSDKAPKEAPPAPNTGDHGFTPPKE